MIRKLIGTFFALAFAGQTAWAEPTTISNEGVHFGCYDKDLNDRLGTLAASGDEKAFGRLLTAAYATGKCKRFIANQQIFIDDREGWLGQTICVRPAGEVRCLWTDREAAR